jgi:tight adherence protein B
MDSGTVTLLLPILIALAIAGAGYAFLGRKIETHDRSAKRLESVAKSQTEIDRKSRKGVADPVVQRRRAVQDQLKEQEAKLKSAKPKPSLRTRLEGAGLKLTPKGFYIASVVSATIFAVGAFIMTRSALVVAMGALVGGLGFPTWTLGFLRGRRQKLFVREFANALEVIVRGVKSGLPVNECLKIIAAESPSPVGPEFVDVVEGQKMGVPLDQGLQKLYERMPIPEVNFFMIMLSVQQKTGGNLSEALGNLARVLRERKKLKMKISAMSAEAKASAGIIGMLPFVGIGGMTVTSPQYVDLLLTDRLGNVLLISCAIWMAMGVVVMAKMINFKI